MPPATLAVAADAAVVMNRRRVSNVRFRTGIESPSAICGCDRLRCLTGTPLFGGLFVLTGRQIELPPNVQKMLLLGLLGIVESNPFCDIGNAGKRILLGLDDRPPLGIEQSALAKRLAAQISGRCRVTDHLLAV